MAQLFVLAKFQVSFTESKTRLTFVSEIILNVLILIHFALYRWCALSYSIDLLYIVGVVHIVFSPNNLADICYEIFLEVVPIELILLLVYNFDVKTYFHSLLSTKASSQRKRRPFQVMWFPISWRKILWLAIHFWTTHTAVKTSKIWSLLPIGVTRIVKSSSLQGTLHLEVCACQVGFLLWDNR